MRGSAAKLIRKYAAVTHVDAEKQKYLYKTTPGPYRRFLKDTMRKIVPPKKPRPTKKVVAA